ncbi:MAG: short-chain dehydrogenase [Flavicella sp.]
MAKNLLKLAGVLAAFAFVIVLMERYLISINDLFGLIVAHVNYWFVFLVFTISESFLGILPPDLFIVWSKELSIQIGVNAWLLVGLLSSLSYFGGLISYFIGYKIMSISSVHKWALTSYGDLFSNLKKWGGFFVVISALLPVPFSVVLLICGATSYPFKWVVYLSLFRFLRFFSYAFFLFILV